MRKRILIDLNKLPPDRWIYLPNGTRVHPEELKRMFDFSKKGNTGYNRKEVNLIFDNSNGNLYTETIGEKDYVISNPPELSLYPGLVASHSHPIGRTKYGVYYGTGALSTSDIVSNLGEERSFMRHPLGNKKVHGEIHTLVRNYQLPGEDKLRFEDEYYKSHKTIAERNFGAMKNDKYRNVRDTNMIKKSIAAHNQTLSNVALSSHAPFAQKYYRLSIEKGEEPSQYHITKIRSISKDIPEQPDYSVAQALLRKKRKKKVRIVRKKKPKRCVCKKKVRKR